VWASRLRTDLDGGLAGVGDVGPGEADAGAGAGQVPQQGPSGVAALDAGEGDHHCRTSPGKFLADGDGLWLRLGRPRHDLRSAAAAISGAGTRLQLMAGLPKTPLTLAALP
jgi:hypothetical protein